MTANSSEMKTIFSDLFKYKFSFVYCLLSVALSVGLLGPTPVRCLYEDQVSKFDWRSSYVGHLKQLSLINSGRSSAHLWQTHSSIIFSTESHVLTSLHLRNGSIQWRHLLESDINTIAATESDDCPVMTINGMGTWIRCWTLEGMLVSEKSLPSDYLEDIEQNGYRRQKLRRILV